MSGNNASKNIRLHGVLLLIGVIASACSGSVSFSVGGTSIEDAAIGIIERDLAETLDLGATTGECEEGVNDLEVGETFTCTGTLEDGGVVEYEGTINSEEDINVVTTNAMNTDLVEQTLFDALTTQVPDVALAQEEVECGSGFVLLEDGETTCEVTAGGGPAETVRLTFDDTDSGDFEWQFE